jgi:hypothetical protein
MWTFILADLAGNELGEIRNASGRNCTIAMNRASTASFTVRADNEMLEPLFAQDTLLKVYEEKVLRFYGNVVSSEATDDGEGDSIRCNAANPAWKLAQRLLGLSTGGTKYEGDKAKTARKMINELNTDTSKYPINPHTGIKLLPEGSYVAGSSIYVAGPYAPALSCINDLAHNITGFDWFIKPIEGENATVGPWTVPLIGQFEGSNAFGAKVPKVVFEHGYGTHNVKSRTFIRDLSDVANQAFHLPDDGFGEGGEARAKNAGEAAFLARGRYEQVADAFGLSETALRDAWLEEFIRVKKNPRFVVNMTLDVDDGTGRVPQLGTDFWIGDMAQARSVVQGNVLFDGEVRIYGVSIEVNEAGTGTVTPMLLDEEGEAL